ncbi:hypothetical protein CPB83DRAFT_837039 [Crepidotus variabilis]|uniref:Uncharacterized protein n=1 Tax=Crepidotus variabilis TaxID=179855 RepID=A0A9P6ED72_9AGAR|nr:hypothetical protein CPB83DRAFT_837039 [Crepidotus variabilis]
MHSALHAAYKAVSDLDPLPPGGSAAEEEAWFAQYQLAQQYAGRIFEHLIGVGEASGTTVSDNGRELLAPAKDPPVPAANKRHTAISSAVSGAKPIDAQELVGLLVSTEPLSLQRREDAGFIALLQGYKLDCTVEQLKRLYFGDNFVNKDLTDCTKRVDAVQDINARLLEREQEFIYVIPADATMLFLHGLNWSVNALMFAADWEVISADPNGRSLKLTYRSEAFKLYHAAFMATMHTKNKYDKMFKQFMLGHEKVITACNTLLKLFDKFGCVVLLDPIWAPVADYTHGSTGRTPVFASIVRMVTVDWMAPENYQENNGEAFLKVVRALGGNTVYMQKFVDGVFASVPLFARSGPARYLCAMLLC